MITSKQHHILSGIVQSHLPPGVSFWGGHSHNYLGYDVKFTDLYFSKAFFERTYISVIFEETLEEIMKDVKEFNELWNSPLMEALR